MTLPAKSTPDAGAPNPAFPENKIEAKPSLRGPWLLAVVVGGLLAVVCFSPLREYLGRVREVSQQVRQAGLLAPAVLTFGAAVLVAVGFPRLLLCVISGMALGFWSGLLWAQLGTLLGNYLTFLAVRSVARDWGERYLSKRGGVGHFIQREGIPAVILARQLPVPGLLVNLGLALSPVRHRDFLIGTAFGQLPEAVPCTLIGAGALQSSFLRSVGLIGLAAAGLVVAWFGLRFLLRRIGQRRPL